MDELSILAQVVAVSWRRGAQGGGRVDLAFILAHAVALLWSGFFMVAAALLLREQDPDVERMTSAEVWGATLLLGLPPVCMLVFARQ